MLLPMYNYAGTMQLSTVQKQVCVITTYNVIIILGHNYYTSQGRKMLT